jgi:hypothetical protein
MIRLIRSKRVKISTIISSVRSYNAEWATLVNKETKKTPENLENQTPEGINLKPVYSTSDIPNIAGTKPLNHIF